MAFYITRPKAETGLSDDMYWCGDRSKGNNGWSDAGDSSNLKQSYATNAAATAVMHPTTEQGPVGTIKEE